jgi:hypothetical protein
MDNPPEGYRTQIASDIVRDGLGGELLDVNDEILAEVFRSDSSHTVAVTCWSDSVADSTLHWLIEYAEVTLAAFEDGMPLPDRRTWDVDRR